MAQLNNPSDIATTLENLSLTEPVGEITVISKAGVDLKMAPYSDRSFLVWGESTRSLVDQLKNLHGRFGKYYINPENPEEKVAGWIFSKKELPNVELLFDQIESGQVQPQAPSPGRQAPVQPRSSKFTGGRSISTATTATTATKTVPVNVAKKSAVPTQVRVPGTAVPLKLPAAQLQMQTVTYSVVRPTVGMKATINVNPGPLLNPQESGNINAAGDSPASVIETRVTHANPNAKGSVEDVYVEPIQEHNQEEIYKMGIVNGAWQVIGFLQPHSVTFSLNN